MAAHTQDQCPEEKDGASVFDIVREEEDGELITIWQCNTCKKRFKRPTEG